jgi:integrase
MGLEELANQYLDHAQRKFVVDTYKRKCNVCKKFLESQGNLPVDQISPLHIHNYLKTLPSNSSYNEHREELSTVFNWIKKTYVGQLPFLLNPCIAIDKMPEIEKEKDIPTEEELLRIIAAAKPGDEKDLVLCCLHLLGRIDEILRLRWKEDINFDKRIVTLWTRKRKDGAYESNPMPMDDVLYDILWQRWKSRDQDKWVFYNSKTRTRYLHRPKVMASICQRAGIAPIGNGKRKLWRGKDKGKVVEVPLFYGFHSLRHFTASYLADQEKVSLKTVSGLLRHKNLRTTEIYLHHLDPSHKAAISKMDDKFTSNNEYPQAPPASITEKGLRHDP